MSSLLLQHMMHLTTLTVHVVIYASVRSRHMDSRWHAALL